MFGLSKLWNAVAGLAAALTETAALVTEANGQLRQRLLGQDDHDHDGRPALRVVTPEPEPVANGTGRRRKGD